MTRSAASSSARRRRATSRGLGSTCRRWAARPIDGVRLVHGDRMASAPLPFRAYGLTRRALDAALLDHAARRGAQVLRGHAVRGVLASGPARTGWTWPGTASCRGMPSSWRPASTTCAASAAPRPGRRRTWSASRCTSACAPDQAADLAGHVEVLLLRGGYAGLQLVEGGVANLCLLMRRADFAAAGACWPGVQDRLEREAPHLRRRLAGAAPLLDRPLSIFRVPYGYVHRPAAADLPGLFRLGDQMAVIPSFTGDGVSIALHTAFAAAGVACQGCCRLPPRNAARPVGPGRPCRAAAARRAGRTGAGRPGGARVARRPALDRDPDAGAGRRAGRGIGRAASARRLPPRRPWHGQAPDAEHLNGRSPYSGASDDRRPAAPECPGCAGKDSWSERVGLLRGDVHARRQERPQQHRLLLDRQGKLGIHRAGAGSPASNRIRPVGQWRPSTQPG